MKTLFLILALLSSPAFAVQPDEVLDDPKLEMRARTLSQGLRCLVCRNENIDDSNADLARDLRILVRERLLAGDSDDETLTYLVDRYGEYVLLNPTVKGSNWILWGAGPGMLILAALFGFSYLRRRSRAVESGAAALNDDETARLTEIMKD